MNSKIIINPYSRKQESVVRQVAPLIDYWSRRARQDLWIQSKWPTGNRKGKPKKDTIKKTNNKQMNSRIRIIRWLSLLLLSAGLVGWSQRMAHIAGWRQQYLQYKHPKKFSLRNFKQIIQTYQRTMENQLKTMRWLSMQMLSEGPRWELQNLAHFSWFRRP